MEQDKAKQTKAIESLFSILERAADNSFAFWREVLS
jgi:hypothetical protein